VREKVAVYFPNMYNFSGELYIVTRERVRVVDITAQAAMKFIVSGGMIHLTEHHDGTSQVLKTVQVQDARDAAAGPFSAAG